MFIDSKSPKVVLLNGILFSFPRLQMGVDFLGEIPLVNDIRELSDSGNPITISRPEVCVEMRNEKRKQVIRIGRASTRRHT
jgi:hypothetical protein